MSQASFAARATAVPVSNLNFMSATHSTPLTPTPHPQASFASRMSHSCTPNCAAVVVSVGGRLTIAMYAKRKIEYGEWRAGCARHEIQPSAGGVSGRVDNVLVG